MHKAITHRNSMISIRILPKLGSVEIGVKAIGSLTEVRIRIKIH